MKFDDAGIFGMLESAGASEINEVNFGVVRMNPDGSVALYNAFESKLSGLDQSNVLGRNFFE
jgi:hypothetical protein